jgi:glycosyltransferase involved in cell wall biosynthesis
MGATGVSILIPTHNRGAMLDRTLDSIAAARVPAGVAVELVVVANACTDDTVARVRARAAGMPFSTRCVEEPVVGLGAARNACVKHSSKAVCALLDDDVRVNAGWLEALVGMYEDQNVAIVAGRTVLWWEAVARPSWLTPLLEMSLSSIDLGEKALELHAPDAVGANVSFRREVYDAVGPFRTDLDRVGVQLLGGGETYFVREAMKKGYRLWYSPGARVEHWVAPHRIEAPYLVGVTFGSSYANVVMKERYGVVDGLRSVGLGAVRVIGFGVVGGWAVMTGNAVLRLRARVRRAAGRGQMMGAIARARNGALRPTSPRD